MATLIYLPEEVQGHIANFLRSPDNIQTPFVKVPQIANIQRIHRNFETVLLWKNFEWKEHIRQWRDENLTKMQFKYQYGILPEKMIEKGWERKINKLYRHQNCYVKTTWMDGMGAYCGQIKEIKVIWFEATLFDLVTGIRPLPSCFGSDGENDWRADVGLLQLTAHFLPAPTLDTLIPKDKRREWLIECFMECVLQHWGEKIVEKNGGAGVQPDFMKKFKNMMGLPPNYPLSQTDLFKMFLKELQVRSERARTAPPPGWRAVAGGFVFKRSQNIEDLCRKKINLVK